MRLNFLLLLFCLLLSAVAHADDKSCLEIRENQLALGPLRRDFYRQFHKMVEDPCIRLASPGFIVGVEKCRASLVGAPGPSGFNIDAAQFANYRPWLRRRLDDRKRQCVTHIAYCEGEKTEFLFKVYDEQTTPTSNIYNSGYEACKSLQSRVESLLCDSKYTHVFLVSMGWNDPQIEAVDRINKLVCGIKNADKEIKPLTIAITWPSTWYEAIENNDSKLTRLKKRLQQGIKLPISYPNKANDADEVGLIWANLLLHQVLANTKKPVVLIGHSFGARLLTRAMVSQPLLDHATQTQQTSPVKLSISLQGAFSIHRFLAGHQRREGSPYRDFGGLGTQFIMTSSRNDTENPLAYYVTGSKHVGSDRAFQTAANYPSVFHRMPISSNDSLPASLDSSQILYLDGTTIIPKHSGVFDTDVTQLLAKAIKQYAAAK